MENHQRPGILERGEYRILDIPENPDAEPPCPFTRTALIVYGKRVGTTVSVCTEDDCPVHDPDAAKQLAPAPAPTVAPATEAEAETGEEAIERQREAEQPRKEHEEEQERKAEERRREFQRQQEQHEAERARVAALHQSRAELHRRERASHVQSGAVEGVS